MSFPVSMGSEDSTVGVQTIYVLRHGDRVDFSLGSEKWKEIARRVNDPPLSADVGAAQVVDLHAHFRALVSNGYIASEADTDVEHAKAEDVKITKIVTSPFLRCIQTANPIAQALDLPLCVENSLWEVVFTDEVMPSLEERACYYPRIDLQHKSCFQPEPKEPFPEAALERYGKAAFALEERYMNQGASSEDGLVICTHAAGVVSVVSALLRRPAHEVNAAMPCGLYRLQRQGKGDASQAWLMHAQCGQSGTPSQSGTKRSAAVTGVGTEEEDEDGECDGRGCQISHLKLSNQLLAGMSSKTGAWPVATEDLTEEEKAASAYSVVYPTWADNFLDCSKQASWLK